MKKDISGVVYEGNKITVNAALDMDMVIYSHPGDNIELNIDITNLRKEVVSGDLLIFTPSNKVITLVNFAGMVLEGLAPKLKDASRIYENPEELFLSRAYKSDSDVKKYVIFREVSSPDVNDEPGEKLSTARMLDNEETAIAKKVGELYTIEQNVVPQFGPYFQDYQIRTLGHSGDFVYDSRIIFISNVFKRYKEDFDFTEPNLAVKVKPKIVPLYGSMYEVDESIIDASGGVYVFMQNGGGSDDYENAYRSMYSAVEYDLGQAYFGGSMALYVEDDTDIQRQFKVDFTNPYVKVNTIQISGLPKGIELYSVDPSNVRVQKAIGSGPSLYIVTNNGGVGGIPLGISYTWDPTNPLFLGEGKVVKVNVSMDGVHSKNNSYLYGSVNFTMVFNTVRDEADVIVGYNTFTFSLRPDPMIIDLTYDDDFVNAGAGDHTYQTLGGDDDVYMFFPEDDHGVFFSTSAYLGDGNDVYHAGVSTDNVLADASYVGDTNQDLASQFVDVLYLNRVISSKYGNEYTFSFSGNTLTATRDGGVSAKYSQFEIIYLENANDYSTVVNDMYDYTAVDIDNGLTFNGTDGLDKNVLIDFGGEQSHGDTVLSTVSTQLTVVENDIDPSVDLYVYQISSGSSGVSGLLLRDLENLNLSDNYSDVVIVNDDFVTLKETLKVDMGDSNSNVDKDSISFVNVTSGEITYYSSDIQVESGDTFIGGTPINLNVYGAEVVRGSEVNANTFYGSSNSGMEFYGGSSSNDVVTYAKIINNGVKVDLTLSGRIEVNKIDAKGMVITGIDDTLFDIESVIASNQDDIFLLNENDSYFLDGAGGSNTLNYGSSVVGLDVEIDVVIANGTSDFTTSGTVKKNYNTDEFVNFQNIVTSDSNNDNFVINYDTKLSSNTVINSKYDAGVGGYDTIDYSSFDVFLELDVSLNPDGYYSISYADNKKVDYFKNFEYIKLTQSADQVHVDLDSVGGVVIDAVDSTKQDPNLAPNSGYLVDTLYVSKKSHEYKMQDYTNLQNFQQVVVSDTNDFKVFLMKDDSYTYLIDSTIPSAQHKELVVNGFVSNDPEIDITYDTNGSSIVNWDKTNSGAQAIGFNIVTGYVNKKNIFNVSIDLDNYSTLDVVAFNGSVVQTEDTLDLSSSTPDSSNLNNGVVFNLSTGEIYYNDAGQYSGPAIATFSEFEKFIGTTANDIFIIDNSLSAFYTIDGDAGTDYVSYELSFVAIQKTEADITTGYAGIEGIIATSYNDYFDLLVDSNYVNVGGGGGFDTVKYTATAGITNVIFDFAVDGSVTVAESGAAAGAADNLSRFESYIGTGGVDKFIFANTDLTTFVSPDSDLIIDGGAGADEVSFDNKSGVTTSLNVFLDNSSGTDVIKVRAGNSKNDFVLKNIETINLTEADDYVYVGRGYSSANSVTIDGKLGVNTIDFSNAYAVKVTLDISTLALTNTLVTNVDFKNFTSVNGTNFSDTFKIIGAVAGYTPSPQPISLSGGAGVDTLDMSGIVGESEVNLIDGNSDNIAFNGSSAVIISNFEIFKFANNDATNNTTVHIKRADVNYLFDGNVKYDYSSNNIGFIYNFSVDNGKLNVRVNKEGSSYDNITATIGDSLYLEGTKQIDKFYIGSGITDLNLNNDSIPNNYGMAGNDIIQFQSSYSVDTMTEIKNAAMSGYNVVIQDSFGNDIINANAIYKIIYGDNDDTIKFEDTNTGIFANTTAGEIYSFDGGGGTGVDELDFSNATVGLKVDLDSSKISLVDTNLGAGYIAYKNFEKITLGDGDDIVSYSSSLGGVKEIDGKGGTNSISYENKLSGNQIFDVGTTVSILGLVLIDFTSYVGTKYNDVFNIDYNNSPDGISLDGYDGKLDVLNFQNISGTPDITMVSDFDANSKSVFNVTSNGGTFMVKNIEKFSFESAVKLDVTFGIDDQSKNYEFDIKDGSDLVLNYASFSSAVIIDFNVGRVNIGSYTHKYGDNLSLASSINMGNGDDTVYLSNTNFPNVTTDVYLDGENGNDTVSLAKFDTSIPTISVIDFVNDEITVEKGGVVVTYKVDNVESFVGSRQEDVFKVKADFGNESTYDGGGAPTGKKDTLDYSSYNSGNFVILVDSGIINKSDTGAFTQDNFSNFQVIKIGANSGTQTVKFEDMSSNKSYVYDISSGAGNANMQATFDYSSFNTSVAYTTDALGNIVIQKNQSGTVTDTIIGDADNIDKIILTSVDDKIVIQDMNDVPSVSVDGGGGTNIISIEFSTLKGVELDLENQTIKEVGGTTTFDFNITGGFSVYNLANTNNVVTVDALNDTNDKYRTINFTGGSKNGSSVDLSSFLSGTVNLNSVNINFNTYDYNNQAFDLLITGNGGEYVEVNDVSNVIFGTKADSNYVGMSFDFYFETLSAKYTGIMGDVFSATVDADVKRTINAANMATGTYEYITVDGNFAIKSGNDRMVINGVTYFRVENWSGVTIDEINLNLSGTNGIQSDIDMYFGATNVGTINKVNVNGVKDGGYVIYNGADLKAQGDKGDIFLNANLSSTEIKFGTPGNGLSSVSYTFKYDMNTDAGLVDAEVLGDESVTYDMSSVTAKTQMDASKDDILVDGTTGTVTYPYVVNGSDLNKEIKGFSKVMLTSVDDSVVINNVPTTVNASGIYIIDGGLGKNSVTANIGDAAGFVIGFAGDTLMPGGTYDHAIDQYWNGTPEPGLTMGITNFSDYTINTTNTDLTITIRGPFTSLTSNAVNLDVRWDTAAISGVSFSNIEVMSNGYGVIEGNYLGEDFVIQSSAGGNIKDLSGTSNYSSDYVMDMENISSNTAGTVIIGGGQVAQGADSDYVRFINVNTHLTLTLVAVSGNGSFNESVVSDNGFTLVLYRMDRYDIDKNMTIKTTVNINSLNRKMEFIAPKGTANNDFVATGQSANITMEAFKGGSDLFVISDAATVLQFENFQRYDIDNSATTELIFNDFKVINHDRGQQTKNDTEFKLSGSGTSKVNMNSVGDDLNIFYDANNKMYVGRDVDGYVVQKGTSTSNGLMDVNTGSSAVYVYQFEEVNEITFGSGDDFFDGRNDGVLNANAPIEVIDMGEGYDTYLAKKGIANTAIRVVTVNINGDGVTVYGTDQNGNNPSNTVLFKNLEEFHIASGSTSPYRKVNFNIDLDSAYGYFALSFNGNGTSDGNSLKINFTTAVTGNQDIYFYVSPYLMNEYMATGDSNYLTANTYNPVFNLVIDDFTLGMGGPVVTYIDLPPNPIYNMTFYADAFAANSEPLPAGGKLSSGGWATIQNIDSLNVVFFDDTKKTAFDSNGTVTIDYEAFNLIISRGTVIGTGGFSNSKTGTDLNLVIGGAGGAHITLESSSITTRDATYEDQLKAEELLIGDPKFDSENETEEEKNLALMDYRYQQNVNYFNEMFSDFDDELNTEEEVVVEQSLNNNVDENVTVDENSNNENIDENNGGENSNIWLDGLHVKLENFADNHPNIVNKIENIMENNGFDGIGSGILIDNNFDGFNIGDSFDKIGQIDNYLKDILDGKYSEVMKSLKDVLENASDYNKSVLKDFANNIFENIVHKNSDYNSENIFVSAKEREEAKNENIMDENYQQKQDENNLAFEDFSDDAKNSLVEESQTEEVSAKTDDSKEEINLKDIFDALDSSSLSGKDVKDSAESPSSYSNDVTHNISEDSLQIDLAEYSLEHAIKSDMHVGDDSAEKLNQQNKKSNSNLGGY